MTDEELKQLVASNARSIQALTNTVNTLAEENRQGQRRLETFADRVSQAMQQAQVEREELRQGMVQLQDVVVQLTDVQQGIANLLASLDQDRPTILRKLTAIENKVDRILERGQGEHSVGSE